MKYLTLIAFLLFSLAASAQPTEVELRDLYSKQLEWANKCDDIDCYYESFVTKYGSEKVKAQFAKILSGENKEAGFARMKNMAKYFEDNIANNDNYTSTFTVQENSAQLIFELKSPTQEGEVTMNAHKKIISFIKENGEWKIGQ